MVNKIIKNLIRILYLFLFVSILGCGQDNLDEYDIVIGTIAGPETELVEVAKDVAKSKYNLNIKIVPFNDYVEPNRALFDGEINSNMFQHEPYLNHVIKKQAWPLVNIGKLYIYPMGAYSSKYKNLNNLPVNATIAIPNDASNQARSLLLLEQANLIQLDPEYKKDLNINKISVKNIIKNPKNLQFEEVDPAFMARMLDDIDLAVINTNYATMVGLLPSRDALIAEDKKSIYANILVVREQDKENPKFKQLLESLRSEEVIQKAKSLFKDQALIAW